MDFALSSSWNAFKHKNAQRLLFEIKSLGFKKVELNFSLTASMVRQIREVKRTQGIEITSVHNFCPIPDGLSRAIALPDCWAMSSLNKATRELCVKYTKRSIDTAQQLGAKAVVLHCGRVEVEDKTRKLIGLFNAGKKDSREFKKLKQAAIKERAKLCKPFLGNTLSSLSKLNQYAKKKDVFLGVENRFYYREIPSQKEIAVILAEFKGSQVFYWHDTGHAQLMENLGLECHRDYLKAYGPKMIGIHLHDIRGCLDHLAPLQGEMDFSQIKPYLKKETLKVMEVHSPATGQDIIKGRNFLTKIFDGIA
jgi:sugar phosphate isomerase/epimerase